MSKLFTLDIQDFIKGLVMAVLSVVIAFLYQLVIVSGFDIFTIDWATLGHNIANLSTITFITYLAKNFMTDKNGKVAGVIPTK